MKTERFAIRHKDDNEITTTEDGQLNIFETSEQAQACLDGPIASMIDDEEDSIENYFVDSVYIE